MYLWFVKHLSIMSEQNTNEVVIVVLRAFLMFIYPCVTSVEYLIFVAIAVGFILPISDESERRTTFHMKIRRIVNITTI